MTVALAPNATRSQRALLAKLVGLLALALMLVAPVDGQSVSAEHRFQLVHPIFPHVHLGGDGHHGSDAADVDLSVPAPGPDVMALPAGPFGAGPIVTSEGIYVPAIASLVGLWVVLALVRDEWRLADQTWRAVPTGPPR